jgi:uncharacterized protein (DUF433 family)
MEGESMAFPPELTSVLTGASVGQLTNWRRGNRLLVPEVSAVRPILYSFRDLVALRTFVRLRADVPLQRIRKALRSLDAMDLTDHPSRYHLVTDSGSVFLVEADESRATDLVKVPGQTVLLTLEDAFAPFENLQRRRVVDFRHPRAHLSVREQRVGGWPTIDGTRVPYDEVARLVAGGISPEDVSRFYPTVSAAGALDAVSFSEEVARARKPAA